eukprot:s2802_g6.t1
MRYNSLVLEPPTGTSKLQVCAWDASRKLPMAIEGRDGHQVYGVQFHPESAGSYQGDQLLRAFLSLLRPPSRLPSMQAARAQAMLAPLRLQHLTIQAVFSHWQSIILQLQEARQMALLLLERCDLAVLRACYSGWRDVYGRNPGHQQRLRQHQWSLRQRSCFGREMHLKLLLLQWWRQTAELRGQRMGKTEHLAYLQEELTKARLLVNDFLEENGFTAGQPNSKRSSWFRRTYPLHEAVKQGDAYITSKLLLFGADPDLKDMWLGSLY